MTKIINTIKKRKFIYLTIIILIILAISSKYILSTFSLLEPIKSITITSNNVSYANHDKGSWKIDKSAKWTSQGKARITFDVDTISKTSDDKYTDIIMVLDTSGSMTGDKLNRVKSDSIELINSILSDSNNKVGLITFGSSSTLISNLTNNKTTLIDQINNLNSSGNTNYYKGLENVDSILKNYTKESNRECIILFLTDGYPNDDTPNEVGEYKYLKDTYPYITINGVQYEMGNTILDPIKQVSDNQFIADIDSLNNVLFDASVSPELYDNFTITDYIDTNFFNIASIDNITTSVGETNLEGNKVTWNIDNFRSGSKATMTIDVTLKEEYLNVGGTYPTNTKTDVESKITGNNEEVTTTNTPVLADNYVVMYDGNSPSNCNVSNVPDNETKSVFTTVKVSEQKPICEGYIFKGWKLVTEDVEKVNNDYFIMPEEDVTLRAIWSKLSLTKSVDGKVSKVQTLYNIMKDQAVMDNVQSEYVTSSSGIDFTKSNSDTNGKGVYERAGTENYTNPIYYYRGDVIDNNVIFAGYCWKMVITTDTGGVKMIYNGVPADGKCNNTGASTQISEKAFNTYYNSLADIGYMYGARYVPQSRSFSYWYSNAGKFASMEDVLTRKSSMLSTNYYYGDKVEWNSDTNKYVLKNDDNSEVVVSTWSSNYSSLMGKYTCFSATDKSCASIYYIGGATSSNAYYITLESGNTLSDYRNLSNNISYDSETGKYTLNNPINVSSTWYSKYSSYKGYYFCSDLNSTTCSIVHYIDLASNNSETYVSMSGGETYDNIIDELNNTNWLYGNSVTYDGTNYTLKDTIGYSPATWKNNYNKLNNNHYTCFSVTNTCSTVYYIYYTFSNTAYYINLTEGKKVEDALSDMLDNNITNSTIKGDNTKTGTLDYWYSSNLTNYTNNYIEDTVYCNDRKISNKAGWDPNGGDVTDSLNFGSSPANNPSITCSRNIDKFTVSNNKGNGMLDYPIGLLTVNEVRLAGGSNDENYNIFLWNGIPGSNSSSGASDWWLASPNYYNVYNDAYEWLMSTNGYLSTTRVKNQVGIRPVISIKPGIRTNSGDGTSDNPYTLEKID